MDRRAASLPAAARPRAARRDGEWHADDDLLVPALRQAARAHGRARSVRSRRSPPSHPGAGQVARGVRHPRRGGHRERPPVRAAGERAGGSSRRSSTLRRVAARPQRGAALDARRARAFSRRSRRCSRSIVDYDAMEIRLVDEETRELYCGYASDEDVEQMSSWRAPLDVGVSGWVVLHNEAQLVNDMLTDPRGALVPGTELGAAGVDHRAAQRGRQGHRRAGARPHGREDLRRARARVGRALRQPGRDRHPERAPVRGARAHVRAARGPAASAPPAPRSEHHAPRHAGPDDVFREVTGMLKEIVDYDAMDIRLVDEETRELVCIYARDENAEQMLAFRMLPRRGRQRLGGAPQPGAARQRHGPRPAGRPGAGHRGGASRRRRSSCRSACAAR